MSVPVFFIFNIPNNEVPDIFKLINFNDKNVSKW